MDRNKNLIDNIISSKRDEENISSKTSDYNSDIPQSTDDRKKEISENSGNYIFTIGNVESGKSSLHRFFVYSLSESEYTDVDFINDNHKDNRFLDEWVLDFKKRVLPRKRTPEDTLKELSIRITPKIKGEVLDLKLVEISGEDITGIIPSSNPDEIPNLNPLLLEYMKTKEINKRFIFVADGRVDGDVVETRNGEDFTEDMLFYKFIKYLTESETINMERMDILFVVSKWDLIKDKYNNDKNKFFEKEFNKTTTLLTEDIFDVSYSPFYIGKTQRIGEGKSQTHKILSFQWYYIHYLTQWVYESFTGCSLHGMPKIKRTFIEKWFGWLL